jgi:hypothetical protein
MQRLLLIFLLFPLFATAQLSGGTITPINGVSNVPASFSTIQEAATYLAANGVVGSGPVVLEMTAGYSPASEPATGIVLDSIPGTTANRRVVFRPAAGNNVTVSLNVAGNGTLNLQRVNFVTFDGRAGGVGTAKALTFINTSISSLDFTSALKLINSSKNNIFQYCTFVGNGAKVTTNGPGPSFTPVPGSGVVYFGVAGVHNAGNNFNKLYRCDINGNGQAMQLFVSQGSQSTPSLSNFSDTIRGCNLFDNFSNVSANIAINLHFGNDEWVVDSNSIYQTVPRSYTVQAVHIGINAFLNFTGELHDINANFIGGNSPGANGAMTLQAAGTNVIGFQAINCQHGEGTFIFGNTIRNINLSYASSLGSFPNAAILVTSFYTSGLTNIGFNNISNLNFSNTNGFIRLRPVYLRSSVSATSGTFGNIQPEFFAFNNVLNNITATGSGATGSAEIFGFACESVSSASLLGGSSIGLFFIYENKLTQLTSTSATPSTGTLVRGITSFNTQGSGSTAALGNYNEFFADTIAGLSTNSISTNVINGSATGISINSGLIDTCIIEQCDISNIANTTTADISNTVSGIAVTNGAWAISRNRIYDLRNGATGATLRTNIFGINVRGVNTASDVYNNQISIGSGQNNNQQVYGIINNVSNPTTQLRVLYNTILISGSPTSGGANSSAIYRGSDTPGAVLPIVTQFVSQNNLCINKRSGGTGIHSAIYNQATAAGSSFSTNFNTLVTANAAQAGQWGPTANNFATWKTNTGGEALSYYAQSGASSSLSSSLAQVNLNNLFFNAAYEANGNLGIDSTKAECWLVAGKGIAIPQISTQFNRGTNTAFPTCIGASEFTPDVDAPCSFESAAPSPNTTTTYTFASRPLMSIAWGSAGTPPSSVCVKYYSGQAAPNPSPLSSFSASYWGVTATGGSGYSYSPTINFGSFERGTVPFADPAVKQSFYSGTGWAYLGPTATANTATTPATSTFNNVPYALGANTALILTTDGNPIPVDVVRFEAQRKGSVNELVWTTAQELNSRWFIVERSTDGTNYAPIGQVAAAGTSNTLKNYAFTDNAPIKGINHYRLRMVDRDNSFRYSWVRKVRNEGLANVLVYPNPVTDKLVVDVQVDKSVNGQLLVIDVSGKMLVSRTVNLAQGQNLLPIEAASLQRGAYLVKLVMEGDVVVRKFNKL